MLAHNRTMTTVKMQDYLSCGKILGQTRGDFKYMSKRFLVILVALFTLFTGAIIISKNSSNKNDNAANGNVKAQLSNHTTGEGQKGVTFVIYGDFQCSACYQYEPIMQQIRETYKNDVTFQFRHYPLSEIHLNAVAAARAAEAAGIQGKFWEMHDLLYQTQDPSGRTGWAASKTPNTFFEDFAKQLNLDVEKFKTDAASSSVNDTIQADRTEAKRLGFNSTPSFVLDDKEITNARVDFEFFKKLIDDSIASKAGQTEAPTETAPAPQPAQ